jgi:hypothetical protein
VASRMDDDRPIYKDIAAVRGLIDGGTLVELVS